MNEVKTFRGVFLALVFYGAYELFVSSNFVLPLPIFELVLLVISLVLFKERRKIGTLWAIMPVLTFLFYVLSRSYNYSFVLKNENLLSLDQSGVLDGIYVFFMLALLVWQALELKPEKKLGWMMFSVPCLILDSLFPMMGLITLTFLPNIVIHIQNKKIMEEGNSIWLYFILLELARVLTLQFL